MWTRSRLEEDIALSNTALDLIGQARNFYTLAAAREDQGHDEDQLAFFRTDKEFQNHLLLEQPNGHFGDTIVRQFFFSAFALERCAFLSRQLVDAEVAGIAAKAVKELQYHWEHAAQWIVRLGDGTTESHEKVQASIDHLWSYTGEFFNADEGGCSRCGKQGSFPTSPHAEGVECARKPVWRKQPLTCPEDGWMQRGGKQGIHSEHLSYMLAEMQVLPRTYPDATW